MTSKKYTTEVGGRTLTAEFTDLAHQADGSCLVTYGGTTVLATAVQSKSHREGIEFFPLTVDFEEKFYAAGRILGSRFVRREGKASEEAVLTSRLIDRTIRPLFNSKTRNEVQVIVLALSIDEENEPDIPAIIASSLALGTSDILWDGPVGAVRISKAGDKFTVNPTYKEMEEAELDAVICGKGEEINMIEAGAKEISESDMARAMGEAVKEIDKLCGWQKNIIKEMGKKKVEPHLAVVPDDIAQVFRKLIVPELEEVIYIKEKLNRYEAMNTLKDKWIETVRDEFPDFSPGLAASLFEDAIDEIIHKNIIEYEKRADGRGTKEIRPLFAKAHVFPRIHGSGVFYRGETHILSAATLGSPKDSQLIEGMEVRAKKRFMHHYNFPPFSSGETKPMRGPGRREIGHGALAERALLAVIPDHETFPYTIRVVSEALSSNGSTSMGSVCASTLALMDAGVPIKEPVAGIAMGLMMKPGSKLQDSRYKVLTDIQGPEDHHGDMDFKVAGTKNGITAVQMDVKVSGIPVSIMREAFLQAKEAREEIMKVLLAALPEPRKQVSEFAPKIISIRISPEKIGDVIGPGGKVINSIIDATGAEIDIEQDGTVFITGPTEESVRQAENTVKSITKEFEIGEVIEEGIVTRIFPFGAMVEVAPSQEGLVHISELAPFRVEEVTDVVAPGDKVPVKVISVDDQGRVNLSIKAVKKLELKSEEERRNGAAAARKQQMARERRNGGSRGGPRRR